VKYVEGKKKVSVPSLLLQIEEKGEKIKRKNFWNNFNREYETLVKERENLFGKRLKDVGEAGVSTERS
jgi:hypothetical protein